MKKALLFMSIFTFITFFSPIHKANAEMIALPISHAEYMIQEKLIHLVFSKQDVSKLQKSSIEMVMNDRYIEDFSLVEKDTSFDLYYSIDIFEERNYIEITVVDTNLSARGKIYFTRPFIPKEANNQSAAVQLISSGGSFHPMYLLIGIGTLLLLILLVYLRFVSKRKNHKPQQAYLVSQDQSETYRFKGEVSIGRSRKNDIVIQDESVSAFQCRITEKNNQYYIQDHNSTNRTLVNQQEVIKEMPLHTKDLITMGEKNFQFLIGQVKEN
jgi:hypothetical protein